VFNNNSRDGVWIAGKHDKGGNVIINITANSNSGKGVNLDDASFNSVINSTLNDNSVGVRLSAATYPGNSVGVRLSAATYPGESNNNSVIHSNKISNSATWGIQIGSNGVVSNASIYNNIINTTNQFDVFFNVLLYDAGTAGMGVHNFSVPKQLGNNIHDPTNPYIGGNYWTNPTGTGYSDICVDADYDGFCDVPYNVSSRSGTSNAGINIDYLPLSDEFNNSPPVPCPKFFVGNRSSNKYVFTVDCNGEVNITDRVCIGDTCISDLSEVNDSGNGTYVPYTGALYNVDLGAFNLTTNKITMTTGIDIGTGNKVKHLPDKQPVAIGSFVQCTADHCVAIGYKSEATENDCAAIGNGAECSVYPEGMALGQNSLVQSQSGVAIGTETLVTGRWRSIGIGYKTSSSSNDSISLGTQANASGANSIALGVNSSASASGSIAIGRGAKSLALNSIAIGFNVTNIKPNTVKIGNASVWIDGATSLINTTGDIAVTNNIQLGGNITPIGQNDIYIFI
jgi:hypothetical protein